MLLRFDNGATGSLSVGQVCAGHKNDLVVRDQRRDRRRSRWRQEQQNELWIGRRDTRQRDACRRIRRSCSDGRGRDAHLPGGHQEGWADAFCNVMRDIYGFIAAGRAVGIPGRPRSPPSKTATARPASSRRFSRARKAGGVWTKHDRVTVPVPFEPQFMKIGVLTAALQELTPRDVRDTDPDRAIEDWLAFARELGADYIQLSAALHPTKADVPPEAMLDPVANTLDLRKPFDKDARARVSRPR